MIVNCEQYLGAKDEFICRGGQITNIEHCLKFTMEYLDESLADDNIKFNMVGYWPTQKNVVDGQEFIRYSGNCFDAAEEQCENGGGNPSPRAGAIDIFTEDKGVIIESTLWGTDYILEELFSSRPVVVGLKSVYERDAGNANNLTDHFVTIVGSGNDVNGNFFSFYDNADGNDIEANRFYYQSDGSLRCTNKEVFCWKGVVTEIRPNE